jgi:hypothetical protein
LQQARAEIASLRARIDPTTHRCDAEALQQLTRSVTELQKAKALADMELRRARQAAATAHRVIAALERDNEEQRQQLETMRREVARRSLPGDTWAINVIW